MVRVPIPEEYGKGFVSVAGRKDTGFENGADVSTESVDRARDLSIRENEDGRYLGCSVHYVEEVVAFLNEDADADLDVDDYLPDDEEEEDAEPEGDEPDPSAEIENGVCPWCDDYEGDGVPQHASAAHAEEWAEYKEGEP